MALRPVLPPISTCSSRIDFRNLFFLNSRSRFLENQFIRKDNSMNFSVGRRASEKMAKAGVELEEKYAPETGEEWGKVAAVLFDMDGVLCNSEELSRLAAVDVFAEMGVQVTVEDFVPFMGTDFLLPPIHGGKTLLPSGTCCFQYPIPITLEMEKGQYISWAALFKIHCRAFNVLDHIIPPSTSLSADSSKVDSTSAEKEATPSTSKPKDDELWSRLDAVVLQRIYGTVSLDLLQTILQPDDTAADAWARLESPFQDNKHSRAVYLEQQFSQISLDNFSSISAYCQELKQISDQLANVGSPVSSDRLVLQLILGLNSNYDGIATLLQQSDPLPSFYEARSKLILEETRKAKSAAIAASNPAPSTQSTAFTADDQKSQKSPTSSGPHNGASGDKGRGTSNGRGRGRGNRGRGNNNNYSRGRGRGNQQQPRPPSPMPWWPYSGQNWCPWPMPPCPYPTAPGKQQPPQSPSPGLLGPRPQQPSSSNSSTYAPFEIDSAMQTMTLNVPDDQWYMDTGASSHMTAASGQADRSNNNAM